MKVVTYKRNGNVITKFLVDLFFSESKNALIGREPGTDGYVWIDNNDIIEIVEV